MAAQTTLKSIISLGQCVPCLKQNASKFKIKRLELDKNLLMYFPKEEFIYASDPEKKCKTGDIVLIEKLPQNLTRLITHEVREVIYPYGDIKDPLTGKSVVVGKFREHIDIINKVYGETSSGFKYDKAPNRGWQEDKKDFTHVNTYFKYHDSGKDEPHAV